MNHYHSEYHHTQRSKTVQWTLVTRVRCENVEKQHKIHTIYTDHF